MLRTLLLIYLSLIQTIAFSNELNKDSIVPISRVFYKMGSNTLNSFTYNYGINTGIAIVGTYGIVHSGFDWSWNRNAYNNKAIVYSGMPSVAIGGLVPMIIPAGIYLYGRKHENTKLQITGLAMVQAAVLAVGITTSIKAFTGRKPPGILEKTAEKTDYSADFRFGFLRRGAFNGWPSGHTTTAFAMAVTLTELYPNNLPLKIGALTYASLVGLGVSVNIHWFSDAFAGLLIGYSIGKVVGNSFNQLLLNESKRNYSFYFTPNTIGCNLNF